MVRMVLIVFTGMFLFVQSPALSTDEGNPSCRSMQENWSKAFMLLKERTEALREAKAQAIGQRIEERISQREPGASIAVIVRSVLDRRRKEVAETSLGCSEVAEMERMAYEEWRRCSLAQRRQRNSPEGERPELFLQQRNSLLNVLSDLMIDDAFLQYKTSRPVHARGNSGRTGERSYGADRQGYGSGARRSDGYPDQVGGYGNVYGGYVR